MKLLFLLLSCLTCCAQFPYSGTTWSLQSASGITFDTSGVAYHWTMADIATNTALSGGWTDEIQHLVWTNGASAQVPTNGVPNGVWTDSTHWFTNNGMTGMGSNLAFGFTFKILDCGFFSSLTRPSFWNNGDASGTKTFRIGFDSNNSYWMESIGDGTPEYQGGLAPFRATNNFVDFIWEQVCTNNGNCSIRVYTNGIRMNADSTFNDLKYLGSLNATFFTPSYVLAMGHDFLRVNGPKMYWQDIVGWTNANGVANGIPLSATTVANYHKWSTNNWPHTP